MSEKGTTSVAGIPVPVLRWGLIIFAGFSVLGFIAAFIFSEDWGQDLASLQSFKPLWFIPALGLLFLDWLGGGLRIKALVGPHESRLSYFKCTQIAVVATALGYLTPASTGSAPGVIYGLTRQGLTFGRAAAVNAVQFLANVVFLSLAGLVAWALGAGDAVAHIHLPIAGLSAAALFKWSAWIFGGGVTVVVLLALVPDIARRAIRRLMGPEHPRIERVVHHLDELHHGIVVYWRSGKLLFLLAVLSGAIHFGSRFLLGYVVLRGFVAEAPLLTVMMLHIIMQYLLFVMPTPSGAGIGEVLAAAVMSPFLTPGLVIPYTVVWRIFLNYGTVTMGGTLIMGWLGTDGAR